MGWNKITIDTLTSAEDMISYELTELGATGVEVEDHVSLTEEEMKVMYVDLLPDDIAPDDGKAKISCYFDENENLEHITMQIQAMLERLRGFMDIGAGTISFDKTKEEDWVNNWKKFFKPIRLDEQIVIKPTWETLEDQTEDMIVVEIDPGTAFGTGSHETTKLCIEGMKPYIKEDTKILDVGCGSGILSIIGLKLGAGHAVLTDIDPHAISASEENFEVNHISKDQFEVYQGNVLDDKEFAASLGSKCYPVVVANILADVISPLIEIVDQFLAEDGVFVISGIIDTKEKEVKFADDVESFISYSFKPQLRTVGPKYGKLLGGIRQALTDINGTAAMNELRTNGVLKLDINGNDVELTEEDLLIETAQTEGYVSESDGETSVVLDTNLTPELIEEGFVREIISKIQTMRKEAGFEVMDKIVVYAHGNDKIQDVMKAHEDEIKSEVLADEMVLGETDGYVKEWNINKEAVTMGVKKL